MRILVASTTPRTVELVEEGGHVATLETDRDRVLQAAGLYDAVVVDNTLAREDAINLCGGLRASGAAVLLLISEPDALARISALDAGADDCLSLPVMARELDARLRAIVRRTAAAAVPTER